MEGQIALEEGNLEPLEVVEEWVIVAYKQGGIKRNLNLLEQEG
jgi:hypothetical protein